jgi:hypothetical protein
LKIGLPSHPESRALSGGLSLLPLAALGALLLSLGLLAAGLRRA